jgi:4-amino-4-deoxy-L-arabinose transferase-like glycosyltransferase
MGLSWSNFLYAAFDPAGTITIDKPPLALWVQVAFTKALGFEGAALHLPMALAGVAAVPLTYAAARRRLDVPTALCAAAVLAVFRRSHGAIPPDALVLALLAGGACARRRRRGALAPPGCWAVLMGRCSTSRCSRFVVMLAALIASSSAGEKPRRFRQTLALAALLGLAIARLGRLADFTRRTRDLAS